MLVLQYLLAAFACGALVLRVPRDERADPAQRALARLSWLVAGVWFSWALYLVSRSIGLGNGTVFRLLNGALATFLPLVLLSFIDRLFWTRASRPDPDLARFARISPLVAATYLVVGFFWSRGDAGQSPADVVMGAFVFLGMLFPIRRLWSIYRAAPARSDRARIRYLLGLTGAAVGFSALEAILRGLVTLSQGGREGPFAVLELVGALQNTLGPIYSGQGPLPPIGALFSTLTLYFLYQIVSRSRLLELNEIFGRLASVALQSAALVTVLVVLVSSALSTLALGYPQQALYEVFIASCLLVVAFEPLRAQIEAWTDRVFNRRRQQLLGALELIDAGQGRVVSLPALAELVLARLVGSGRIPYATIYVWDEARRAYALAGERGDAVGSAVSRIPRQPFAEGFAAGEHAYVGSELRRLASRHPDRAEAAELRRQTLDAMGADVAVPLMSGDVVLGWIGLRDEDDADGFAGEEVQALHRAMQRLAAVVENLQDFDLLKEEYRLAALGTMSAGLAHEIRNPLAAIKGAAQLIRAGAPDDGEMVDIVVKEVDRLNTVVTQFLEYARPLQLRRELVEVGALLGRARLLLQGQCPPEVEIQVEVEAEAPPVAVDEGKVGQVLLNLGLNGIQAMKRGGQLQLRAARGVLRDPKARDAPALLIAVSDSGVGIAPDDLDKLFVPFFTTRHDGTGLGLAICRRIVREHGGELDVESAVGRGTTFTLRLPLDS